MSSQDGHCRHGTIPFLQGNAGWIGVHDQGYQGRIPAACELPGDFYFAWLPTHGDSRWFNENIYWKGCVGVSRYVMETRVYIPKQDVCGLVIEATNWDYHLNQVTLSCVILRRCCWFQKCFPRLSTTAPESKAGKSLRKSRSKTRSAWKMPILWPVSCWISRHCTSRFIRANWAVLGSFGTLLRLLAWRKMMLKPFGGPVHVPFKSGISR